MKAIVRDSDGLVSTIINDPPAGWQPDPGFHLVDYIDLPQGWQYIPQAAKVPDEVAGWRLRAAASIAGLATSIDAAIAALPEPNHTVASLAWNQAATIRRDSPMVAGLAAGLGLTDVQVDNLYIQAQAIEA